ncbi:MAG TPA: hypothetical protein VE398_08050 [Acidobacteriota bacterium]|nr:hypothetical protein [Acidobacteriota bacterium]
MTSIRGGFIFLFVILAPEVIASDLTGVNKRNDGKSPGTNASALWSDPEGISSRDLFYGSGGEKDEPHGPYIFVKEDLDGSNPKLDIRDRNQVEWKVKLGIEARPETVASRLIWAVGYFTNEDYFLPELRVDNMPAHLHRGQKFIAPDGSMHNVRLKRQLKDEKKIGAWRWRDNPFAGTRQINGLRVMMALMNNWDLKDENNAIYRIKHSGDSAGSEEIYMVSDLGASFGTTGITWPLSKSKGNLESYSRSKFTRRMGPDYVDFCIPSRPALFYLVSPRQFVHRLHLRWLGKHIPHADVMWIGQLLGQLSPDQIRDAFRAAGYSPQELEGFTQVVLKRIAELNVNEEVAVRRGF